MAQPNLGSFIGTFPSALKSGRYRLNSISNYEKTDVWIPAPVVLNEINLTFTSTTSFPVFITNDASTTNDSSANYRTQVFNFTTNGSDTNYDFYLGIKTPTLNYLGSNSTTYFNDFCLGAFQLFTTGNATPIQRLAGLTDFSNAAGNLKSPSGTNYSVGVSDPASFTYINIFDNQGSGGRWTNGSSTNSQNTGAVDGVDVGFGSGGSLIIGAQNNAVSQASSTDFAFFESSSSGNGRFYPLQIPLTTLSVNTNYNVKILYHFESGNFSNATSNGDVMYAAVRVR